MKALSEFLRPEFLSRVDEIIVFHELREPVISGNCTPDAGRICRYSEEERNITFAYDDRPPLSSLAEHAIGGKSGARDLRTPDPQGVEDQDCERCLSSTRRPAVAGIAISVRMMKAA